MPFSDNSMPINTNLSMLNWHFSAFRVKSQFSSLLSTACNLSSWDSLSGAWMIMSSDMFSTPSMPARTAAISCWYCSLAEETPNINLLNLYIPLWTAKVVMSLDSGVNSNWWYPHFRSSLLNMADPFIPCNSSSTVGIGNLSRMIAAFACLMSKHILISAFALGTMTTGFTQGVAPSTFSIMSMLSSSLIFFSTASEEEWDAPQGLLLLVSLCGLYAGWFVLCSICLQFGVLLLNHGLQITHYRNVSPNPQHS